MSDQVEILEFSTELAEIPIKIDKEDYVLREASGGSANVYNNDLQRATKVNQGGKGFTTTGVAEINTRLLSYCLFKIKKEEGQLDDLVLVPLDTIKKWPDRIQSTLIEKLKEISNVDEVVTLERDLLLKAFQRSDAPIDIKVIRDWVERLFEDDEDYEPLWEFIKPTGEENSKNS